MGIVRHCRCLVGKGEMTMSELNYTFDEMWEELKNQDEQSRKFYTEVELLTDWFMARPHWWQFRKRKAWKKAMPPINRVENDAVKLVDFDHVSRVGEGEKDG